MGARLDVAVRRQAQDRSLAVKISVGLLVAGAAALLAKFAGADVRAGFGAGQPDLMHQAIRGVLARPTSLG
ncbi:MAG TPA: hypothetical protein VF072_14435 [Thermoleophilaceae bacterium]